MTEGIDNTGASVLRTNLLIHTGHYNEALQIIRANDLDVPFQEAYIQYKLEDNDAALKLVKKHGSSKKAWMMLEAQIMYQLGKFKEAAAIYKSYLDTNGKVNAILEKNVFTY